MLEYLETLRNKPRHVRKQIALLSSSLLFGLIFTVWISARFISSPAPETTMARASDPLSVVANTFSGIKDTSGELTGEFQKKIFELNAQLPVAVTEQPPESLSPPLSLEPVDQAPPTSENLPPPDPLPSSESINTTPVASTSSEPSL